MYLEAKTLHELGSESLVARVGIFRELLLLCTHQDTGYLLLRNLSSLAHLDFIDNEFPVLFDLSAVFLDALPDIYKVDFQIVILLQRVMDVKNKQYIAILFEKM